VREGGQGSSFSGAKEYHNGMPGMAFPKEKGDKDSFKKGMGRWLRVDNERR